MSDDFRIFMALRFNIGNGSYAVQRDLLDKISWQVVDAFRAGGLCAVVSSYPSWTDVNDMGDFSLVHPVFPVNGIDCLCVQVQMSPLRESFSDASSLAHAGPECRKSMAEQAVLEDGVVAVPNAFHDRRWSACVQDFHNAGFTKSIRAIFTIQSFNKGILLLSTGGMPSALGKGDFEASLFLFWANFFNPEPKEMGFIFEAMSSKAHEGN